MTNIEFLIVQNPLLLFKCLRLLIIPKKRKTWKIRYYQWIRSPTIKWSIVDRHFIDDIIRYNYHRVNLLFLFFSKETKWCYVFKHIAPLIPLFWNRYISLVRRNLFSEWSNIKFVYTNTNQSFLSEKKRKIPTASSLIPILFYHVINEKSRLWGRKSCFETNWWKRSNFLFNKMERYISIII